MVAIPAAQVPTETALSTQTFAPAKPGGPYTVFRPLCLAWQQTCNACNT